LSCESLESLGYLYNQEKWDILSKTNHSVAEVVVEEVAEVEVEVVVETAVELRCIKPLVMNVAKVVKCHSDRAVISLYTAVTALKGMVILVEVGPEEGILEEISRCIGPLVVNVEIDAKFLLSLVVGSLFYVATALRKVVAEPGVEVDRKQIVSLL
jgi:hypothetical protein